MPKHHVTGPRPGGGHRRVERGAVAVEFAFVLPLLAMMLLGTITAGFAYTTSLGLTNAVREGARFAATTKYPSATGSWTGDVLTRTRQLQFDDPGNQTQICVDLYRVVGGALATVDSACNGVTTTPSTTRPAVDVPAGAASNSCIVRVWAARPYSINAVLVNFSNQVMTRQSVAIYERAPC